MVIDVDATLVTAHSEKEHARPGNAGSNTAADHIAVITAALAQLPGHTGPGRREQEDPGAHRRGRVHPHARRLAGPAAPGLLGRVHVARPHPDRLAAGMRVIVRKERPHPGA